MSRVMGYRFPGLVPGFSVCRASDAEVVQATAVSEGEFAGVVDDVVADAQGIGR